MIKGIIFDCFGVIVGRGFDNTYRAAGGNPQHDREFIDDMLGQANLGLITDDDFRNGMAGKVGIDVKTWRQAVLSAEQPDIELLNYVKRLRTKYKTAILSNANLGSLDRKIGRDWLEQCFDVVVVSAEIGIVKPDPKIYYHTADRLQLKPTECVFIDDVQLYVNAASDVGMKAFLYRDFASLKDSLENLLANAKS